MGSAEYKGSNVLSRGAVLVVAILCFYLLLAVDFSSSVRIPLGSNITAQSVTLSNGLELLLLSEPAAVLSTVALAVQVGSYESQIPGLAHLVEHIVVSRSRKYPEPDYFTTFLTRNGGKFNAFTDWEETNFYFDVKHAALEEALNIFASYFTESLLSDLNVESEVQAVNSEHLRNFQSEQWQGLRLLQLLANPLHPFATFTTGSSTTLAAPHLTDLVQNFITTWYKGGCMKVVVYSCHTLPDLVTWATSAFSTVPTGSPRKSQLPHPFADFHRVVLAPLAPERHVLVLYWPLLPQPRNSLPVTFLSYLLAIPTGLEALLRTKGLILDLSSQVKVDNSDLTLLSLELRLTYTGFQHWQDILQEVASYVKSLATLPIQQSQRVWNFYATRQILTFDYKTEIKSGEEAAEIAGNMLRFPKNQYLSGYRVPQVFDWSCISQSLASLSLYTLAVLRSGEFAAGRDFQGRKLQLALKDAAYSLEYEILAFPLAQGKARPLLLPFHSVLWPVKLAVCESCPLHSALLDDSWFLFDQAALLYASASLLYRSIDFSLAEAALGQLFAQVLNLQFEEVQAQKLSGSLSAE